MNVTAISKDNIYSLILPDKVKGHFWIYTTVDNKNKKIAQVEAVGEKWVLKPYKNYAIFNNKKNVAKVSLSPLRMYILRDKTDQQIFVFTEPATIDRQLFQKYIFDGEVEYSIGRDKKNDIVYDNGAVSLKHAKIKFVNDKWFIQDTKSTNGTFVNNKRIDYSDLHFGDVIYIMGLKIILGKGFIAINNPDYKVSTSKKLINYIPQPITESDDENYEKANIKYFFRSPRFKRNIETAKIKVDSPPNSPIADEMPIILVLGTSMTMGMMSIVTLSNAVLTNNIMSMAMGGSMLLGTVLFPIVSKQYEKSQKYKKEKLRQKKYHEYLDKIFVKLDEESQSQSEILHENIIPLSECEKRILEVKRNLWDRGFEHDDFLKVRVGLGEVLLDADVSYSEKKFTLEDDNLQEELYMLCETPKYLINVPITYSLKENFVSGIIGNRDYVLEFTKGIIFQLASLYSYDEVKFIFIYDKDEENVFDFARWLPHTWSNDNNFRFIASDTDEVKEISSYMGAVVEARQDKSSSSNKNLEYPYYVVFSYSKTLASKAEFIKQIYASDENMNISILALYNDLQNLPKECSMVVELNNDKGRLFDKNDLSGSSVEFAPDININHQPDVLAKNLSNIYLDFGDNNYKLPDMISFMTLFEAGNVEHLNVLNRWKENDPTKSLAAAVGVDTFGDKFMLDLHEKFHGPHGLVAGMTGSGKSEFIITFILSLALNYHPHEVSFVLIDYKGGGMAKSFEKLPHTVGIITNLDGAAIKRSLVSIESELKRRQAIFSKASKKVNVSNIDIYKYQKLYRDGQVDEPLSHLFIISDEFAELKTQQPEFMTQLVSAARIGRSLGVHLILATQKPSGVVDDQIWSNSRFRVCLKVQERADSQDMLKRPDAAELVETGRFYLQVGYNELFEMGQSAWSGAPYYPTDVVEKEQDLSVQVIDNNAHVISAAKIDKNKSLDKNPPKQVDVITQYLCQTAEDENIVNQMLWLEPIKPMILVVDIVEKYSIEFDNFVLNPLVGEYDDPARQQQCPLFVPLSTDGNVIVYGSAGSGKTTFISSMVWSLINYYTPEEVNMYLIDFASETLRAFKDAPQVGDIVVSSEEEKIHNLFKMLIEECNNRKKLFADYGGDYSSYIKNSRQTLPSIVVTINNYAAFSEIYEDLEEAVTLLTRDGSKYGLYFVITATSWNSVRFRLAQNFNQTFCLQLNDESDYSSIVGRTEGLYPSKFKGRGLFKLDNIYEFQTAHIVEDSDTFGQIKQLCQDAKDSWDGKSAKKVPLLPEVIDKAYLSEFVNKKSPLNLPIGVNTSTLEELKYDFGKHYINLLTSSLTEYSKVFESVIDMFAANKKSKGWIIDAKQEFTKDFNNFEMCSSVPQIKDSVDKIFELVLYRNNTYKSALEKGEKPEMFDHVFVFINSVSAALGMLDSELKEKLSLTLEKGNKAYNVIILIGEQISNVSSFAYEPWYKAHISGVDGIWVGSGIAEQYQLKVNDTSRQLREKIPANFGYAINKGVPVKAKLIYD